MEVVVPKNSGFCPGVNSAERNLFLENSRHKGSIYVYGNLINNSRYIAHLSSRNVITAMSLEAIPAGELVAIRTHGIAREEEAVLRKRNVVVDLTCANVKKVQLKILEFSGKGFFVVITGKKRHPEVTGLKSYAERVEVIETEEDLRALAGSLESKLEAAASRGVFVVSQTTGDQELFQRTIAALEAAAGAGYAVSSFDSICPVTSRKEKDAISLQEKCDVSFVVGDRESSNAMRLYEALRNKDAATFFVEDLQALKALDIGLAKRKRALVVSSASTPKALEEEIVSFLESVN